MFLQRSCRIFRPVGRLADGRGITAAAVLGMSASLRQHAVSRSQSLSQQRSFHASGRLQLVKPVLLADIGEGIVECEIIQWFVEPGARVEEFSPLCEVQSDKASVEITSRFAGVIKKLHYEAGEMAKVGKPFVDIDIPEDVNSTPAAPKEQPKEADETTTPETKEPRDGSTPGSTIAQQPQTPTGQPNAAAPGILLQTPPPKGKFSGSSLATPAVRHLSKELSVDITQVDGTGKDGRVTKEDLYHFSEERKRAAETLTQNQGSTSRPSIPASAQTENAPQQETSVPLSGTQLQMFKSMTRSLAIPHFLYADEIDFTRLFDLRKRVNATLARGASGDGTVAKLSYLPFVIKALSIALIQHPVLNARVDVPQAASGQVDKPNIVYRTQHNIGVAMDTPSGLIVPVIRNVNARSVLSISAELVRLQRLAEAGRLTPVDLQGGTITVSNIGNVGGTYLSPVIVEKEVAILGIGRVRTVPAFAQDVDEGVGMAGQRIVKRHICHFSFSADHRVVDGATAARAVEVIRQLVEKPDMMAVQLR